MIALAVNWDTSDTTFGIPCGLVSVTLLGHEFVLSIGATIAQIVVELAVDEWIELYLLRVEDFWYSGHRMLPKYFDFRKGPY